MKNLLKILLFSIITTNCTSEPEINNYNVSIINKSTENLLIEAFSDGDLVSSIDLMNNEFGLECSYSDENFRGFFSNKCNRDSLILKFSNNKGYIVNNLGSGNFNFSEQRNPFLPNGGFEIENDNYKFVITQSDFDNAFDLQ